MLGLKGSVARGVGQRPARQAQATGTVTRPSPRLIPAVPFSAAFLHTGPLGQPARRALVSPTHAVAAPDVDTDTEAAPEVEEFKFPESDLYVSVTRSNGKVQVQLNSSPAHPGMYLHWAIEDWKPVPDANWPKDTRRVDDKAVQTQFQNGQSIKVEFNEDSAPTRMTFVLKRTQPEEKWLNNGGGDFIVPLAAPKLDDVFAKVIDAESSWSHFSLFQRFILANETLDAADAAGPKGMGFMYTWFRLSSQKHLDWYRNTNYQSKDIAHVQKHIAERMADKARSSKDARCRMYARMTMECLPRGGGNGDDIRMGILNIMRANGIKEGHRPGLDEKFLEQWHQKLHTNTTPDDVPICEAYLAFLHSGNHDDYWRVLWERGNLTKEHLAKFSKPLTAWPMHLPHLIGPFKHFLWILKVTHSGADLDTAMEMAKGCMDDGLRGTIYDILHNRNEWWVPGKIVDARMGLQQYWKAPGASRDLLLLDLALDNWFRIQVEKIDKASLNGDSLLDLCTLVLRNAQPGVDSPDLAQALYQLEWAKALPREWHNKEWACLALAACQRAELSLSSHMDKMYSECQPHAETFGKACKIDDKFIQNFGEEAIRSRSEFMLSLLLQHLEPKLREAAGVSPWQVVSQGPSAGAWGTVVETGLADIQGQSFADKPTVLLSRDVGGMEDIPVGVEAVITRSATDVLSHVAIRARSQGVLLATCLDENTWKGLVEGHSAKYVHVVVDADGSVRAMAAAAGSGPGASSSANGASKPQVQLQRPKATGAWALKEDKFEEGLVGAKSLNLSKLRGKLPDWIHTPSSVALPFGTFDRVLNAPANAGTKGKVEGLLQKLQGHTQGSPEVEKLLTELRDTVAAELAAPPELISELSSQVTSAGLAQAPWQAGTKPWKQAWSAICQVWASKWGYRAWLSRRACNVAEGDLHVAVLLQQVVAAEYAYVLHTAHPVTGAKGELFGEVCIGMGESLVGNRPGRALSFVAAADGGARVLSLPTKPHSLHAPAGGTLIARSDANGEDLEGFAGAGLYDSIPFSALREEPAPYSADRIMTDPGFRSEMTGKLADVGKAVKAAFGGTEQDVEGCYANGAYWVVQSRPQVLA